MKNVRETSIKSYLELIQSGKLKGRQLQAFESIMKFGPCTAMEAYNKQVLKEMPFDSNIRARLHELRRKSLVVETGKRVCSVTGKTAILWDVVHNNGQMEMF